MNARTPYGKTIMDEKFLSAKVTICFEVTINIEWSNRLLKHPALYPET